MRSSWHLLAVATVVVFAGACASTATAATYEALVRDRRDYRPSAGRDIQRIRASFDSAEGSISVQVRFYGPVNRSNSAFFRTFGVELMPDGSCQNGVDGAFTRTAVWTFKGSVGVAAQEREHHQSLSPDRRVLRVYTRDSRLVGRRPCVLDFIRLSRRNVVYDEVRSTRFQLVG